MDRLTYTVSEAADVLGVGRNHMYALIRSGQIPYVPVGRRILIPRTALITWLDSHIT